MIAFKTIGGTGNRMFIYAASSALLKQGKYCCVSSFKNLHYFKLSTIERILNFFEWYIILVLRKLGLVRSYDFKNGWIDHSKLLCNFKGNAIVTGYFQGLKYFGNIQDEIRRKFEIKKKYRNQFDNFITPYKDKKFVAIQIRRTDYLDFNDPELMGPDLSLPISYYYDLIEQLRKKDAYQFIVMSDDKQYLHDHFEGPIDVIISDNDEIIDLQILIHSDVCVISHSSFGWWGAWLNEKSEKLVFVPEFYLGFKVKKEYPIDIIPAEWNKVKILTS